MTRGSSNDWLLLFVRLTVGGVFLYAGIIKIISPLAFADSIASFQILPKQLINLFAITLPTMELMVGGMLMAAFRLRSAAFAIMVLTGAFGFGLIQALARGLDVDCGCFGTDAPSVWKTWLSLGRDVLLFAAALLIYVTARVKESNPLM